MLGFRRIVVLLVVLLVMLLVLMTLFFRELFAPDIYLRGGRL